MGGAICISLLETEIQPWAVIEKNDKNFNFEKTQVKIPVTYLKKKGANYF